MSTDKISLGLTENLRSVAVSGPLVARKPGEFFLTIVLLARMVDRVIRTSPVHVFCAVCPCMQYVVSIASGRFQQISCLDIPPRRRLIDHSEISQGPRELGRPFKYSLVHFGYLFPPRRSIPHSYTTYHDRNRENAPAEWVNMTAFLNISSHPLHLGCDILIRFLRFSRKPASVKRYPDAWCGYLRPGPWFREYRL
jgi:hypothetical protein